MADDESNDALDANAEGHWGEPRDLEWLIGNFRPYVHRRVSMALLRNPNLDRDEAIQCGTIGLWKAVTKYDPASGTRFTTFAQKYVDGAIIDCARDADTAPTKLRTAEKRGEVGPLPVMFPLEAEFDCRNRANEVEQANADVRELLEAVKGTAVERDVVLWLACNGDLEVMASNLGVSVQQATILWKSAADKLRDPQEYMDGVKELPTYEPPADGPRVQKTMFGEDAA